MVASNCRVWICEPGGGAALESQWSSGGTSSTFHKDSVKCLILEQVNFGTRGDGQVLFAVFPIYPLNWYELYMLWEFALYL